MTAEKTILRTAKGAQRPYFVMARSTAQDATLSFEARGLLGYLLSKPDDWKVEIPDLMREGGIGRDKTKNILKELRDAGYIITEMLTGKDGRFAGKIDRIHDTAVLKNRPTENQDTGNPQLHNTEVTEEEKEESVAPNGSTPRKVQSKAQTVRSTPVSAAEQHPERTDAEWAAIRQQRIEESTAQTNREIARQKNFAALEKAVKVLPGVSGKLATQYAHMLNGTATKGVYSEYRIEGGITAVEFETFIKWYPLAHPNQGLPKVVETLHGYVNEWVDAGKPAAPASNGADPLAGFKEYTGKVST